MPERRRNEVIGIESIDAIVLARGEYDVVRSLTGNLELRYVERLGVKITINRVGKNLAEGGRLDVGRLENELAWIETAAGIVVMESEDVDRMGEPFECSVSCDGTKRRGSCRAPEISSRGRS